MEGSVVTNVLLPGALALIMFGLGLSLTVEDFLRVVRMPKAVLVGLFAQTFLLTFVCAMVCIWLALPPDLAIGMMLLAAAPGGASANVFSHLAHGDLALNITLTAINSVLALVTLPIIVSLSFAYFKAADQVVPPPFAKIVEVSLVVLLPVAAGMLVRARAHEFASRAERLVRVTSVVVLATFSVIAIWKNSEALQEHAQLVGAACILFNLLSMLIGYALPRALGLSTAQAIAVAMEVGIHNAALAIYIAINVLGDGVYAIPAAVYSVVMFVTATVVTGWMARKPLSF
ncbi:MAG: bile acid:sodium symporter family protein [Rhodocyclaceae bacterium]|nr:bile acid:sodium symporter family protein [Rhodocyclaceae bacterium]MCA3084043.1 bile acid:sodium symporter family protein [Rhodocyclaceae bacterium]